MPSLNSKRSFPIVVILILLAAVLLAGSAPAMAASGYKDVKASNPVMPYITYLQARHVLSGYADGSFRPNQTISRAEMAVVLINAASVQAKPSPKNSFKDVDKKHWAYAAIETAYRNGFMRGYPDGTFRPGAKVTRAEAAAMLLNLSGEATVALAVPAQIKDVGYNHWAKTPIAVACETGMMRPISETVFGPDWAVTRAQAAQGVAVMMTTAPRLMRKPLAAELVVKSGSATVEVPGQPVAKITASTVVNQGATVKTGLNSEAELKYPDGSSLLLKADTELTIQESRGQAVIKRDGSPGQTVDHMVVKLAKGKLFGALATSYIFNQSESETTGGTVSKLMAGEPADDARKASLTFAGPAAEQSAVWYKQASAKRVRVTVDMPWGVAGVRGTIWGNAVSSTGQSTEVADGSVEVSSSSGASVSVGEGQSSTVSSAGTPPTAPTPMTQSQQQEWSQVQSWVAETVQSIQSNAPVTEAPSPTGETAPPPAVTVPNVTEIMSQVGSAASTPPAAPVTNTLGLPAAHESSGSPSTPTTTEPAPKLTNLTVSNGATMSIAFSETQTTYNVTVLASLYKISVIPTGSGTIYVNGSPVTSGSSSPDILVPVGSSTITIICSSAAGSTTYTLNVSRDLQLTSWWQTNPSLANVTIKGIAYGNGKYVAIGANGYIASSPDGTRWVGGWEDTPGINSIVFGKNRFIAVGDSGYIMWSVDGECWNLPETYGGTANNLLSVCCSGDTYLTVGENGATFFSLDGQTWTQPVSGPATTLTGVVYGNNAFVAVGAADGSCWVSNDNGDTWPAPTSGVLPGNCVSVAYGAPGGTPTFMTVSSSGNTYSSTTNGTTWSGAIHSSDPLNAIACSNNRWVAVGQSVIMTYDGSFWSDLTAISGNLFAVAANGTRWLVAGEVGTTCESTDGGSSWGLTSTNKDLLGITYGGSKLIAVGDGNSIYWSSDGITWSIVMTGGQYALRSALYAGGRFVAVGSGSGTEMTAMVSNTGESAASWSSVLYGSSENSSFNSVAYGKNKYVTVGGYYATPALYYSSDAGASWNECLTIPGMTTERFSDICFMDDRFIAVAEDGKAVMSNDGVNWSPLNINAGVNSISGIVYGENTWVAVGQNGIYRYSLDGGTTWSTSGAIAGNPYLTDVAYGHGVFLAVDANSNGNVYSSPDGISWALEGPATDTPTGLYSIVSLPQGFALVGEYGTVLVNYSRVQPS
ncbi:MAG: S-layer homology domain-containing protein [Solirubrobacterales bacterium]